MAKYSRRTFPGAAAAGTVRIKNIEIFPIEIPIPREELEMRKYARNYPQYPG